MCLFDFSPTSPCGVLVFLAHPPAFSSVASSVTLPLTSLAHPYHSLLLALRVRVVAWRRHVLAAHLSTAHTHTHIATTHSNTTRLMRWHSSGFHPRLPAFRLPTHVFHLRCGVVVHALIYSVIYSVSIAKHPPSPVFARMLIRNTSPASKL